MSSARIYRFHILWLLSTLQSTALHCSRIHWWKLYWGYWFACNGKTCTDSHRTCTKTSSTARKIISGLRNNRNVMMNFKPSEYKRRIIFPWSVIQTVIDTMKNSKNTSEESNLWPSGYWSSDIGSTLIVGTRIIRDFNDAMPTRTSKQ